MKNFDIVDVQKKIGYVFKNWELLFAAFTHASYANENNTASYERLEFLGDSIVNFVVADYLYKKYPDRDEGFLTKMRSSLVSQDTLCAAVDDMDVIEYLMSSGGAVRDEVQKSVAVKEDLFEAVTGAIFADSGDLEACRTFVLGKLEKYANGKKRLTDFKSAVYEECSRAGAPPEFRSEALPEGGFAVSLYIGGEKVSEGKGLSKKKAEQQAAGNYIIKKRND